MPYLSSFRCTCFLFYILSGCVLCYFNTSTKTSAYCQIQTMSCKKDQIQEEQVSLLQSSSQPQSNSFANVPFQPNQRSSVKTQEDKSFNHNQSCKFWAQMIADPSLQNPSINHSQNFITTHSNDQNLDWRKVQPTQIQPAKASNNKMQSDVQRQLRQMIQKDELRFQELKRQNQINLENMVKQINEKLHLQRLQKEEQRQRIIAMNTYSDEISIFQNIKRWIGIIRRSK